MSSTPLTWLSARTTLVLGGAALLVVVPAAQAYADPPPSSPSGLAVTIGDRYADLSWTDGDGTGAIVRDVTGLSGPYDSAASGRLVTGATATAAHDTGFQNTTTTTYAIWSTAPDGTPTAVPLVQDVPTVPPVPTAVTLHLSSSRLTYGLPVTVTGFVSRAGVPVAGEPVDLLGVYGGTTSAVLLKHLVTDVSGEVNTTLAPTRTVSLRLSFAGDSFSSPSASPSVAFTMLPRVTATARPASIVTYQSSAIGGAVAPAIGNTAVFLQRRQGSWVSVAKTVSASTGAYRFTVSPGVGSFSYRTVFPGGAAWGTSVSPAVTIHVTPRNLVRGTRGPDVLVLQRRLAVLHYSVGALDGVFGLDLMHAVITFQKVERLPRTGTWTGTERLRALHPTVWIVRYGSSGRGVEVDITRQVLVYSENRVVKRIVDVSTGGEYRYTSDGVSYVAHTPRGHFRIQRKINGVQISRLGYLYRPSYFYLGYAIHGEGYDVPSHPASHGCVRVTNRNADYLYPLLAIGTPVTIFDE